MLCPGRRDGSCNGIERYLLQISFFSGETIYQSGEPRRVSEFPMGGEQRTLEDLVRELLRPMMSGWLEEKLMPIVERRVTGREPAVRCI
jgi:Protein of unknown function (DUF2497)